MLIQSTNFSLVVLIYKIYFFDKAFFPLTIMTRVAPTHKFAWHLNGMVLWGRETNETYISTYRRRMDIKLKYGTLKRKVTWLFHHVTTWNIYISIFTRFIATRHGIFSTQALQSSSISCSLSSFPALFLDGLSKVIFELLISELLIWNALCF